MARTPVSDPRMVGTVIQNLRDREHLPSIQKPASDIANITVDFQSNARNSIADAEWEELDVRVVLGKVNAGRGGAPF